MEPIVGFQLEEIIKSFTFREEGGVEILKKWRERAVICQLDVEIVSTSREKFLNYSSNPAHAFYGYATLVMRDFVLPQIKIVQPRQTLYISRNEFALTAWQSYDTEVRIQENFRGIEQLVCFNTGLLGGACVPKECKELPQPSFDEFPLREIYFKTLYGTQFKVEYSFFQILPMLSNCGEIVTPKSKQRDGEKDRGMPRKGAQPQRAKNPNDPYKGLPAPSPESGEGIIPKSVLDGFDNPNPDNEPLPDTFYLKTTWTYFSNGVPFTGTLYTVCEANSRLIVEDVIPDPAGCGQGSVNRSAWASKGDTNIKDRMVGNACTIGSISAELIQGVPPNQ